MADGVGEELLDGAEVGSFEEGPGGVEGALAEAPVIVGIGEAGDDGVGETGGGWRVGRGDVPVEAGCEPGVDAADRECRGRDAMMSGFESGLAERFRPDAWKDKEVGGPEEPVPGGLLDPAGEPHLDISGGLDHPGPGFEGVPLGSIPGEVQNDGPGQGVPDDGQGIEEEMGALDRFEAAEEQEVDGAVGRKGARLGRRPAWFGRRHEEGEGADPPGREAMPVEFAGHGVGVAGDEIEPTHDALPATLRHEAVPEGEGIPPAAAQGIVAGEACPAERAGTGLGAGRVDALPTRGAGAEIAVLKGRGGPAAGRFHRQGWAQRAVNVEDVGTPGNEAFEGLAVVESGKGLGVVRSDGRAGGRRRPLMKESDRMIRRLQGGQESRQMDLQSSDTTALGIEEGDAHRRGGWEGSVWRDSVWHRPDRAAAFSMAPRASTLPSVENCWPRTGGGLRIAPWIMRTFLTSTSKSLPVALVALGLVTSALPLRAAVIGSYAANGDGTFTYWYRLDNTSGSFDIAAWSLEFAFALPDWDPLDVGAGGGVTVPDANWVAFEGVSLEGGWAQDFLSLDEAGDVTAGSLLEGFSFKSRFRPGTVTFHEFSAFGEGSSGFTLGPVHAPSAVPEGGPWNGVALTSLAALMAGQRWRNRTGHA